MTLQVIWLRPVMLSRRHRFMPCLIRVIHQRFFLFDGTLLTVPERFETFTAGFWAVRDGDISSVPGPPTLILILIGISTVLFWKWYQN